MKALPETKLYFGYDLLIASSVTLPSAREVSSHDLVSSSSPDIKISIEPVNIPDSAKTKGFYAFESGIIYGQDSNIARFACHADGVIQVEAERRVSSELVGRLLVSSAIPATLWMMQQLVLHAGSVLFPDQQRAIALGGQTGSGKSSVLEQLMKTDAKFIADDNVRLTTEGPAPLISGFSNAYCRSDNVNEQKSGRPYTLISQDRQCASARLSAFFYLEPYRDCVETRIVKVAGVEALQLLLASRHRPEVLQLLKQEKKHLHDLAILSETISVFRWARASGQIELSNEEANFLISEQIANI